VELIAKRKKTAPEGPPALNSPAEVA